MGIEPTLSAWEAEVLPLNYTRDSLCILWGARITYNMRNHYGNNLIMKIFLNGKPFELADKSSASNLLESLQLTDKKLAMEINQEIVPRSQYHTYQLANNDKVEIVHAIGGG